MNDTDGACGTYGERIYACRVLGENVMERNYLKNLGIGGRIILNWILKKSIGRSFTESIWFTIRTSYLLL